MNSPASSFSPWWIWAQIHWWQAHLGQQLCNDGTMTVLCNGNFYWQWKKKILLRKEKKKKAENNLGSCWRDGKGRVLSSPHINVIFITSAQIIPHNTPVLTVCSANSMDIPRFMDISHCQRTREIFFMRPISGGKKSQYVFLCLSWCWSEDTRLIRLLFCIVCMTLTQH